MQDKKIKFSNVISTVKIERGVLKIRQLRLFALTFMIGFLGSLIWIGLNVAQKFPLIVQAGLLFSGLILVWGVYDVATSKVVFNYFIESDLVQIKARKKAFKLNYNGSAKSVLSLSINKQMKDDNNRDRYMVVLNFEDKACHIPFALSGIHLTLSNAKEDLHDWSRKLNLI